MIAISGVAHLAGEEGLLQRLCAESGIDRNDMRSAAATPGFLAAILDFYLGNEPALLAFAAARDLDPAQIAAAGAVLNANASE
jgi:hypothetical protein